MDEDEFSLDDDDGMLELETLFEDELETTLLEVGATEDDVALTAEDDDLALPLLLEDADVGCVFVLLEDFAELDDWIFWLLDDLLFALMDEELVPHCSSSQ
jgi:hypothetical protein